MTSPILFWVQHLLGTGHLRRTLTLAAAVAATGRMVTVVSGGVPQRWALPEGVELVQLPPLQARDSRFSGLVDADGQPPTNELWAARAALLAATVARIRPQVIVTEMYPFGRGAFQGEIDGLIAAGRRAFPELALAASVRDVLVSASAAKLARMRDRALVDYDSILVHGDPGLVPFSASFAHAGELGDRLHHTGYIAEPLMAPPVVRCHEVLVTAGGGRVGADLLAAAAAASPLLDLPGMVMRIVTGMGLPEERFTALAAEAGPQLIVERHHPSLAPLLARAAVSVSQAGYNTVVEALAAGVPMVLVPFAEAGEDEQTRRAQALAEREAARHLPGAALTPQALAAAIRAVATAPSRPLAVDLDGAARSAALLATLPGRRR